MNAQQVLTANYTELTKYAQELGIKYVGIKKEVLRDRIQTALMSQEVEKTESEVEATEQTHAIACENGESAEAEIVSLHLVDAVGNPIKIEGDKAVIYSRKTGNKLKDMPLSQFEMGKKWLRTEEEWLAANALKASSDRRLEKKERQPKTAQKSNSWTQDDDAIAQQIILLASNRCDRARLILQLTQKYSAQTISEKINLSASKIQRESRAREIYDSSPVIQELFAQKRISWAWIHDNLATKKRSIEEYESMAREKAKPSLAA